MSFISFLCPQTWHQTVYSFTQIIYQKNSKYFQVNPIKYVKAITKNKNKEFETNKTNKITISEENWVEDFISELKYYRFHILLTHSSIMKNIRKIIATIIKRKKLMKSYYLDSDSDFNSDSDNEWSSSK